MRSRTMAHRLLTAAVALSLSLGLCGLSRAQDASPPAVATEDASTKAQSKASADNTTKSPGEQQEAQQSTSSTTPKHERATFGAGCFWHVEDTFERLRGVNWAVSG